MSNINVLDLFAGCGGLSTGLKQAGFNIKWACELDEHAAKTYSASHPDTVLWQEDVNTLLARCISNDHNTPRPGEVDLLAGGPPCQGFSGYNRHRSVSDPRNSLVESYLSFVDFLRPRHVLMENVPGMLQMEDGKTSEMIFNAIEDLGYKFKLWILQAGNYGLAQNRWRVFIIASIKELYLPVFPEATHDFPKTTVFGVTKYRECIFKPNFGKTNHFGHMQKHLTVGDVISDLPPLKNGEGNDKLSYLTGPQSEFQEAVRKDSIILTNHRTRKLGEAVMERIRVIPKRPGAGWLDLPEALKPQNLKKHGDNRYPNRFGRLWWEGIFNTIVTKPEPYWGRFIHPDQNRVLSVRECARAQGFPDSVTFYGGLTSQYKQIGNAVPPPLAKSIGKAILSSM